MIDKREIDIIEVVKKNQAISSIKEFEVAKLFQG
jgi:hypothetical protein